MNNKIICVYAICKNEKDNVDKWLNNMSEADYIVILDTGSTDGTFEVLQPDKRVYKVEQKVITPWRFDVARNESLKLVPDEATILVCTDFDELWEPGWADQIKENWNEDTWKMSYPYAWNHTSAGESKFIFYIDKIHNKMYHWIYPCHEILSLIDNSISTQEEETHSVDLDTILLHHWQDLEKNRSYYLDLLQLRIQEFPNEAGSYYFYARELGSLHRINEAIDQFLIALEHNPNLLLTEICYGYLGDLYFINKAYAKAIFYYQMWMDLDENRYEPYIQIADVYLTLEKYNIALGFINEGLKKGIVYKDWVERAECHMSKPYDIACVCYYNLGKIDKALECCIQALRYEPYNEILQNNYIALLEEKGDPEYGCCIID